MSTKIKVLLLTFLFIRIVSFNLYIKNGDNIQVSGRVLREPTEYETSQVVLVDRFRVYVPLYPVINYGDTITVRGVVSENSKLTNATVIDVRKTTFVLFILRERLIENLLSMLPYPHNAIVAGTVIGSQKAIGEDFWDALKKSGTAHIVVASGTNITYTAIFLMSILLHFVKRRKAIVISIVGVWVYVGLSGFDPPLVRAAIMGSFAFGAQVFGRVTNALQLLLYSVLLMIFINPVWLSDVGFGLSFYATAGLILFESHLYDLMSIVPDIVRKDLSTTLAAQIGVAPLLYITFKYLNIFSPVYNILVLWTIPPIMILGVASGVVSLFNFQIGRLLSLLIYPFTSWFVFFTTMLS